MTTPYLDPATYAGYSQDMTVNIQGVHTRWSDVPAHERSRIAPTIRDAAALMSNIYDVELDTGRTYFYLDARFRDPPTPADVLALKTWMCGLLIATSWGGP